MLKLQSITRRVFTPIWILLGVAFGMGLLIPAYSRAGTIVIKNHQRIVFLGDSITANGWNMPGGYIHLVVDGLAAARIHVTPIPAGISGNTSKDMLARLNRDVLSKKPNWMTLSCGVNDVWHGPINGVALPQYKKNITQIVDRAQAAGIHVIILTATLIGENPNLPMNKKLMGYNAFLRKLAVEKHCRLVDLSADEIALLHHDVTAKVPTLNGHYLTMDGVHPIAWGNVMFARGILRAMGLNRRQMAAAKAIWMNIPQAYPVHFNLTLRQCDALRAVATARHCSIDQVINQVFNRFVHQTTVRK